MTTCKILSTFVPSTFSRCKPWSYKQSIEAFRRCKEKYLPQRDQQKTSRKVQKTSKHVNSGSNILSCRRRSQINFNRFDCACTNAISAKTAYKQIDASNPLFHVDFIR